MKQKARQPAADTRRAAETLVETCARHAAERGERLACVYLADGSEEAARLTFAALDAACRSLAARLLERARPGDRALLVYEAGADFVAAFMACLYAGLVAVPLPAPEASRLKGGLQRLDAVARDCEARLLLGTSRTHELLRDHRPAFSTLTSQGWVDTQALAAETSAGPPGDKLPAPRPEGLAYLQYTSGSTAEPKGVMVSHANLIAHLAAIREALEYDAQSVSVTWMPHFHDYGLIEGILLPLANATPTYLMSPFAFLKRPACWLEAISRYRGTHTEAANFAYRYCARRVTPEQRAALDLSSLRSMGNGGEPIHPETCAEFYRTFAACGLREHALAPAYGLAEATLMVTSSRLGEPPVVGRFDAAALARGEVVTSNGADAAAVVSCGRPLPHTEVVIADPETRRRLPAGRVGEVWVASPGVAGGYWQRPEESAEVFRARLESADGAAYLRTGDLGFLHDGQLFITGRAKDLIIVHGLNYAPQDIEWTVQQAHPALRADNGAAFSIEAEGEERLCVVQEVERRPYTEPQLDAILEAVVRAIADTYGLVVHAAALIRRGSLLKTTSGKIQRSACRRAFLEGALPVVRAWQAPQAGQSAAAQTAPASPRTSAGESAQQEKAMTSNRAGALIAWLRDYAERRIHSRLMDERRSLAPPVVLDLGNRGFFGLQVPEQWGGQGLGHADALRVYQQLGAVDLSLATLVFLHNTNGLRPLLEFASPALREELVPRLAAGRELAAFALSEPGAGTNLAAVAARAEADGRGGWTLHGVKRWNGTAWAGVINVFARLVEGGRLRGLTGFVVLSSEPGVVIGPEALTMGMRSIMQNELRLEGAHVSAERLLGQPGGGMAVVEHVLAYGRLAAAAVALGGTLRCAQLLRRYASRREIETGILLHNPQAAVQISGLLHRAALDSGLLARTAEALDRGEPLLPEIAMALKLETTRNLNRAADTLMQLLGGRGYMENNLAPQILRDARALSIGEGANESLRAALGRSLRMGGPLGEFLRRYDPQGAAGGALAAALGRITAAAPSTAFSGEAAAAWRDAELGRVACAALRLATAEALGRSGGVAAAAVEWARLRFERACREAEQGSDTARTALSPAEMQRQIDSFGEAIGDLEPLAPEPDTALDPLLRREAPAAPAGGQALEEKRRKLRRLLEQRLAGPSAEESE